MTRCHDLRSFNCVGYVLLCSRPKNLIHCSLFRLNYKCQCEIYSLHMLLVYKSQSYEEFNM